jgi:CheY-like chemotaxis protein
MYTGRRRVEAVNVLVVEDIPDVALTFAALIRAYGHRTQVAFSGEAALGIAREFRPQTTFIDIGLPEMDGYELAARLRSVEGLENSYLVTLSDQDPDSERLQCAGVNLHLKKPVTMDALIGILGEGQLDLTR